MEVTPLNKSVQKKNKQTNKQKEQVGCLLEVTASQRERKKPTLWISEPPLAGVGGEQGEAGITQSQVAVTHASYIKKFGEHCVA